MFGLSADKHYWICRLWSFKLWCYVVLYVFTNVWKDRIASNIRDGCFRGYQYVPLKYWPCLEDCFASLLKRRHSKLSILWSPHISCRWILLFFFSSKSFYRGDFALLCTVCLRHWIRPSAAVSRRNVSKATHPTGILFIISTVPIQGPT